jgi:Cu(I)/Ag(I) efflux system membrane fusion protein/cobalt-zinc-cadmium efflux system membrane fusion protein
MKATFKHSLVLFFCLALLLSGGLAYVAGNLSGERTLTDSGPAHAHAESAKYTCGMHPMIIVDEPGDCPICGMELTPLKAGIAGGGDSKSSGERKVKYWQAPMDPTYIRDEPGKSPMGMDLIPVYEDQAPGGSIISIDPVTAQNMGVRTALVRKAEISREIRTVGLVGYEEPKQYSINAKIAGWVEKLYVNETGQQVRKGQALLDIYSPELVTAQEELLLAKDTMDAVSNSSFKAIAESGQRLLEASRQRLKLWDISDEQIRQIESSGKVQKRLTLYAPYSGIVSMKMVNEGMHIKPGMELFQISDLSRVWVYADLYEFELPWVKVGQQATVQLPYVNSQPLRAKVSYIYPYVEPKTRTVKARLVFDNADFELRPDMYVNVRLQGQVVADALVVPQEAILYSGEKKTIFIALEDGKFEPRQVKVGLQDGEGQVQILQGLLEGERVVTSAQFMLDSESKLREAIQKMLNARSAGNDKDAAATDDEESADDLFGDDSKTEKKATEAEDLFN